MRDELWGLAVTSFAHGMMVGAAVTLFVLRLLTDRRDRK